MPPRTSRFWCYGTSYRCCGVTMPRPRLSWADRALMRMLPKARWVGMLITPATVLRGHADLVKRRWTFKYRHSVGAVTDQRLDPPARPAHSEGEPGLRVPADLRGTGRPGP